LGFHRRKPETRRRYLSGKGGSFWDLTRTGAFLSPGAAAGVASGHERGKRVGSPVVTVALGWWVGVGYGFGYFGKGRFWKARGRGDGAIEDGVRGPEVERVGTRWDLEGDGERVL